MGKNKLWEVVRRKSYSSVHPVNGKFYGPNCPGILESVIFVLRIRHQDDSLCWGSRGVMPSRGKRNVLHDIRAAG